MNIEIIRIGNSQGIRIPKSVLQQCGLVDRAELTVEDGRLILQRPKAKERFEAEHTKGDIVIHINGEEKARRPISGAKSPAVRQGWSEAFEAMAKHGDDAPLLPEHSLSTFDELEWEW